MTIRSHLIIPSRRERQHPLLKGEACRCHMLRLSAVASNPAWQDKRCLYLHTSRPSSELRSLSNQLDADRMMVAAADCGRIAGVQRP